MRVVVALGGHALLQRGQEPTIEAQRANLATACASLAPVASEHELVITHGNGPQVGLLALQNVVLSPHNAGQTPEVIRDGLLRAIGWTVIRLRGPKIRRGPTAPAAS